jgi:hypothetical protein
MRRRGHRSAQRTSSSSSFGQYLNRYKDRTQSTIFTRPRPTMQNPLPAYHPSSSSSRTVQGSHDPNRGRSVAPFPQIGNPAPSLRLGSRILPFFPHDMPSSTSISKKHAHPPDFHLHKKKPSNRLRITLPPTPFPGFQPLVFLVVVVMVMGFHRYRSRVREKRNIRQILSRNRDLRNRIVVRTAPPPPPAPTRSTSFGYSTFFG